MSELHDFKFMAATVLVCAALYVNAPPLSLWAICSFQCGSCLLAIRKESYEICDYFLVLFHCSRHDIRQRLRVSRALCLGLGIMLWLLSGVDRKH